MRPVIELQSNLGQTISANFEQVIEFECSLRGPILGVTTVEWRKQDHDAVTAQHNNLVHILYTFTYFVITSVKFVGSHGHNGGGLNK